MDASEQFELIKRGTEEILTEDDLKKYLEAGVPLTHYIGFEISGKVHLGTGIVSMSKIKDFLDAGVKCTVFLADWHSWINDKLGGDLAQIQRIATGYFKEGLKACLKAVGADPEKVTFTLGTDLYHNNDQYWETFIDVCKNTTLNRMHRSITIMGRKLGEGVDFAKLLYPAMQVADIFIQNVNLAHAGYDQRKAHVVARDVALKMKKNNLVNTVGEKIKPICVHHHLILGLTKPAIWPIEDQTQLQEMWSDMKMSKSIPNSAVFVNDTPEEIKIKVESAFCPEGNVSVNPILDWAKFVIFRNKGSTILIEREAKFGGNIEFNSYTELEKAFLSKSLHPHDLKMGVANKITEILEPVRKHFEKPSIQKMKKELEELMVTR
ncbi:MAG: tyrosine--tRNA ligase [Candidatus Lokiarchaeota archaeon]|nr:tyrosine--tRNA ligase [Candidatus Lokiarchaeota archaeon]